MSDKETAIPEEQSPEQPETPEAIEGEIVDENEVIGLEDAEADAPTAEAVAEDEDTEEAEASAEEIAGEAPELSPEMAALIDELKEARQAADEAREEAAQARQEANDFRDRWMRAEAELQNFRRRKEREVAERIALANESLILELLPVLDDFERAFEAIPEEDREAHAAWIEGFELIYRKLQKILEAQGLEAIDASGEFNPEVHEAVTMTPSDEVESGHIVAEFRKGYKLKDKVIRASLVSVAE
jgi:molecular chaperone GrpE